MAFGTMSAEKPNLPTLEKCNDSCHEGKISLPEKTKCKIIGKMLAMIGDQVNGQACLEDNLISSSVFKATDVPLTTHVFKSLNSDGLTWKQK